MNTLVTYNPVTVSPDDSLARVVRLMQEYDTHHLPVVDDGFHLLGIISDRDVVAGIEALAADEPAPQPVGDASDLPTAGDVMTREVRTLSCDEGPLRALEEMIRSQFHSVPMVRDGRLHGIVTSTDFLRDFQDLAPAICGSPVVRVMSPWPGAVEAEISAEEALRRMTQEKTDYVGVTECGRPIGAVSVRGLRRARRLELIEEGGGDEILLMGAAATVGDLIEGATGPIAPTANVGTAAALLYLHRCDALAVVDPHGAAKGLLTERDLLRALYLALSARH